MELQPFLSALHVVQVRTAQLSERVNQAAPDDALLVGAVEDLQLALETLQVAEEEMRQQHEALTVMGAVIAGERQRYQDLYDFAPDAYLVTNRSGIIQEANQAATQMLGVQAGYLIGKPLPIFVSAAHLRPFRRKLLQLTRTPSMTAQRWTLELRPRRAAIPVPVEAMVLAVPDDTGGVSALRWMLRDISPQRQMEAQLNELNQKLQAIIAAAPLAIISLDLAGNVTTWNPAAEMMFGWQAEEVLGHPMPLLGPDNHPNVEQWLEPILLRAALYEAQESRWRRDHNGDPLRVSVSVTPLRTTDGTVIGVLALLLNITERERLRADLLHTQRQLAESREAERRHLARELHDEVVQQLLGLSYQLAGHRRGVTTGLLSSEERVMQLSDALQHVQDEVVGVVKTLRGVINDLRPPGLEEFGVCVTLEGYLAQVQTERGSQGPQIISDIEPLGTELPLSTSLCLFRVAQEAIRNALQHAQATKVAVRLCLEGKAITLEVEDNGVGFTLPPRWSELTRVGHFGLVGLRERAELADGQLTIRSQPGQGTLIKLSVPLTPQEEDGEDFYPGRPGG